MTSSGSGPVRGRADRGSTRGGTLIYVYGVVPAGGPGMEEAGTGLDASPVFPVESGKVTALVSRTDQGRVRPSRANLSAHQKVVESAHRQGPVLPVRFGTVFPDEETLAGELLEARSAELGALLDRMAGRDEYRLKATYVSEVLLREIVADSAAIRRARTRMSARRGPGYRDGMIELGGMVRAEVDRRRDADADAILAALRPHVEECERLASRSDEVALHAALLVRSRDATALGQAVERIAGAERHRMQLELVGPLPPWDFTEGMTA